MKSNPSHIFRSSDLHRISLFLYLIPAIIFSTIIFIYYLLVKYDFGSNLPGLQTNKPDLSNTQKTPDTLGTESIDNK